MTEVDRTELDVSLAALERRLVGAGGPFELAVGPTGAPRFASGARSLTDLYNRARRAGPKPLFVGAATSLSYSEIFEPAFALAASLRLNGWSGRRIALLLEDGPEWLIWFVAITAAGASCVLPPPNSSDPLIGSCCEQAACEAIVGRAPGPLDASGRPNLFVLSAPTPTTPPGADVGPDEEALVSFTSGSSGAPKGVVHSHRSLTTGLRNMMLGGALANVMLPPPSTPAERPQAPSTVLLSPLSYIAGYSAFLLCIATGGRIVLPESGDDEAVLRTVEAEGVQALAGASFDFVRRLLRHPDAPRSLRSLRRLQLHGSALQKSLVETLGEVVPAAQLLTGYGCSEAAGSVAVAAVARVIDEPGGCGRLLPSVDLRVVDEAGGVLPPGEPGRLQIRGDMLMSGYLDQARTAQAITGDGWYATGDVGRLAKGGWLSVLGRSEERITADVGFAAPIEDAVRALSGIDDAVVKSSRDGKALVLYLQVQPSQAVNTLGAVEALKSKTGWGGAVDVRLVDVFPRTASGKIDRLRLAP